MDPICVAVKLEMTSEYCPYKGLSKSIFHLDGLVVPNEENYE